jgi:hypothetical protein
MAIESKKGPTLLMAKFATCDYLISFMGQPFKDDAKKDAKKMQCKFAELGAALLVFPRPAHARLMLERNRQSETKTVNTNVTLS